MPFTAAFAKLTATRASARIAQPPAALGDLPVVEIAAQPGSPPSDAFAIMMSGDGGWAGLDQDIAAALSAKGIPVVGWDSLRYYWTARTPEGLAADTDRMIRYYLSRLGKKRVLLIGYSQGADVLPFAVNRLPESTRTQVSLMAILGMSEHALFEFHVSSWIADDNSGPLTLPEVNRISGMPVLCIYGEDEHDSLRSLLIRNGSRWKVKGGHLFDGDYAGLGITSRPPPSPGVCQAGPVHVCPDAPFRRSFREHPVVAPHHKNRERYHLVAEFALCLSECTVTRRPIRSAISVVIGGALPVNRLAKSPSTAMPRNSPKEVSLAGVGLPNSEAISRTNSIMVLFSPPSRYDPPLAHLSAAAMWAATTSRTCVKVNSDGGTPGSLASRTIKNSRDHVPIS